MHRARVPVFLPGRDYCRTRASGFCHSGEDLHKMGAEYCYTVVTMRAKDRHMGA